MTFWLDAHLKPDLAAWLGARFKVIAKPFRELGLHTAKDPVVFEAARLLGGDVVIVTKDDDFVELVERLGAPPQVVWLTVGNVTTIELQVILGKLFPPALEKLQAGAPVVEISRSP